MEEKTKRKIEEIIQEERGDADRKYPLFSSLHEGESVIREEIEEVSEVLDAIMETHNWIWKAVRANKSETVKSAAKTIARLSRELIAESVQVAAVAGKIVDSIERPEKRGSHCDLCVTDYDECPCNTCARDNPGAVTASDFGVAMAGNRSAAAARGWAIVGVEGIGKYYVIVCTDEVMKDINQYFEEWEDEVRCE